MSTRYLQDGFTTEPPADGVRTGARSAEPKPSMARPRDEGRVTPAEPAKHHDLSAQSA